MWLDLREHIRNRCRRCCDVKIHIQQIPSNKGTNQVRYHLFENAFTCIKETLYAIAISCFGFIDQHMMAIKRIIVKGLLAGITYNQFPYACALMT